MTPLRPPGTGTPLSFYPSHALTLYHVPNPGFPFHKLPKKRKDKPDRSNFGTKSTHTHTQKASGVRRGCEVAEGRRGRQMMHAALGFLMRGGVPIAPRDV